LNMEGICAQCIHRDLCLGGCVANNFHATGKLNAPNLFCHIASRMNLFPESRKWKFLK
jgi:MoaA/NifB/PqqE/SkfB family radical SAM enzyme